MKVQAIKRGYFGGQIREPGETFEISSKKALGSWMQAVEEKKSSKTSASTTEDPPAGTEE